MWILVFEVVDFSFSVFLVFIFCVLIWFRFDDMKFELSLFFFMVYGDVLVVSMMFELINFIDDDFGFLLWMFLLIDIVEYVFVLFFFLYIF